MVNVGDYGNITAVFDHSRFQQVKERGLYLKAADKGH